MPPLDEEIPDEDLARYVALCNQVREQYEDACRAFSPVTQQQLQAAEECIGFRLPALLRLLYTTVANGGFGSCYGGMLGIAGGCYGGYPYPRPPEYRWTIENTTSHSGWRLAADTERMLIANNNTFVVCFDDRPDGFVDFCDIGCGGSYELDLHTGHVYESWCYSLPDAVEDAQLMQALHERDHPYLTGINYAFSSLEEMFEAWFTPWEIGAAATSWERERPICLGLVGASGITPAAYFEPDKGQAPTEDGRLDDDFFDSDDWKWYLQQPPLDAE